MPERKTKNVLNQKAVGTAHLTANGILEYTVDSQMRVGDQRPIWPFTEPEITRRVLYRNHRFTKEHEKSVVKTTVTHADLIRTDFRFFKEAEDSWSRWGSDNLKFKLNIHVPKGCDFLFE